jgi:hypothetical protein
LPRVFSFSLGNSSIVLTSLTFKWTNHMQRRLSILLSPIKLTIHGQVWMFLPRKRQCPINMYFFECLSHIVEVTCKEYGQVAPFLLLWLVRLRWARLSLMVVNNMACIVHNSRLYSSQTSFTPDFQSIFKSSTSGLK